MLVVLQYDSYFDKFWTQDLIDVTRFQYTKPIPCDYWGKKNHNNSNKRGHDEYFSKKIKFVLIP